MTEPTYTVNAETPAHAVALIRVLLKLPFPPDSLVALGTSSLNGLAHALGITDEEEQRARRDIVAQLEETR